MFHWKTISKHVLDSDLTIMRAPDSSVGRIRGPEFKTRTGHLVVGSDPNQPHPKDAAPAATTPLKVVTPNFRQLDKSD